jgi:hypothetical protein
MSGDTILVGAPLAAPMPFVSSGAVEVFRNGIGGWTLEAILKASDSTSGLKFGTDVAVDGDVAVVAAPGGEGSSVLIYTFSRIETTWNQVDKFSQPTPAGTHISLSGNSLAMADGTVYVRFGNGWIQQALLQPDAGNGENLGMAVAIAGDRIVVGSTRLEYHMPSHYYAYVFQRTGSSWAREGKIDLGLHSYFYTSFLTLALSGDTIIAGTDTAVSAFVRTGGEWIFEGPLDPLGTTSGFGTALAVDGNRAAVSATGDTVLGHSGAGSIYVFTRSGGQWSRTMRLYDPDTGDFYFALGSSIALQGDVVASGSPKATTEAGASGKASVFDISGGAGLPAANLTAGNSHSGEQFGSSVSRSGNTLLIGAFGAASDSVWVTGAAYVLELVNGAWQEVSRLMPTTGRTQGFGGAVALDGDTAAVGASGDDQVGATYIYVRESGGWSQQARLTGGSALLSYFGRSVALEGDLVAVGGTEGYALPGVVHVFERSGTVWNPLSVIQPADSADSDEFGFSVSLSGDTLVVGAPGAAIGIEQNAGAAYVFRRAGALWIQEAKLLEPQAITGHRFGGSVAIAGDTVVVGAASSGPSSTLRGGAYVFARTGNQWNFAASLKAMVSETSETFGYSLSISDSEDLILVGTPYRATAPSNAGAIYSFRNDGSGWTSSSIYYGAAPAAPYPRPDNFGYSTAIFGDDAVIGAPGDGPRGAAYLESVGQMIFVSGFD